MKTQSLEEKYTKQLADTITVSVEDLNLNERTLIREAFTLFQHKLSDIKILNDELYRLNIELANTKAMLDTKDDEVEAYMDGQDCPVCGRSAWD